MIPQQETLLNDALATAEDYIFAIARHVVYSTKESRQIVANNRTALIEAIKKMDID
jgi:hypothetical protein